MKTRHLAVMLFSLSAIAPPICSAGVDGLDYLVGRWEAATQFYQENNWVDAGKHRAVGDSRLGGAFYILRTVIPFPGAAFQFEATFSQDRFNGGYRVAFMDDLNGYLDIYEGDLKQKTLTLTNLKTGTSFPDGKGHRVFGKLEINQTGNGFRMMTYTGNGDESTWTPYMRVDFSPAK